MAAGAAPTVSALLRVERVRRCAHVLSQLHQAEGLHAWVKQAKRATRKNVQLPAFQSMAAGATSVLAQSRAAVAFRHVPVPTRRLPTAGPIAMVLHRKRATPMRAVTLCLLAQLAALLPNRQQA